MKLPSSCNVPKNLSASEMESFVACQSELDIKKYDLIIPCDGDDGLSHLADGNKKRKKVISWPFMLRRIATGPESLGHFESDLKPSLFDQPLSIVCGEEDTLPKPIQDMLTILYLKGPLTEGIFRKAANEKARKRLKEELNYRGKIAFEKEPVHLLAVVLKDFLRNIPNKLLLSELYDEWMKALEKTSQQKRIEAMKEVADKLPRPNLLLLKHLLCVLYHISRSSEVNKMDSSNLAICVGPNILTPGHDQNLALDVQKALTDKVKILVEFLIDNCFNIFGEEIASLFDVSVDDSLDRTEMQSSSPQEDSAYSSTDFEGESNFGDLQPSIVPQAKQAGCKYMVRELSSQHSVVQTCSASSLTCFKNSISNLDRRLSEPNMFSQKSCQESCIRIQKLTKSDENFTHQKELGFSCQNIRMQMAKEPYRTSLYRNKKPPNLTIETSFESEVPSSPFPRTSSSSSLDSASSVSDGSVFTSSPLTSPAASKKNALIQRQSFSTKISSENGTSNRELKKHSVSFIMATHKKVLTKTQSCSISGFQRGSFRKDTKKESHLSRQIVQPTCSDNHSPRTQEYPPRPRFMSADEVFRLVDQKNPGNPPSYEEATKYCSTTRLPSYNSLIIQKMRPASSDFESQRPKFNREVANRVQNVFFNNTGSVASTSKDKMPEADLDSGIHSRANLPLTPQVYRLRTMSGSYQKNKHEYLMHRCSQLPLDHTQCAKESYV